ESITPPSRPEAPPAMPRRHRGRRQFGNGRFTPLDIIFLHGLRVQCVIGVWQWERRINQSVYIDIDMAWDTAKAASSDDLADTLSYKDVSKRIAAVAREGEFNLVETLAERVAAVIIDEVAAPWCRVRVSQQGAVSSAAGAGVIIERGSKPWPWCAWRSASAATSIAAGTFRRQWTRCARASA